MPIVTLELLELRDKISREINAIAALSMNDGSVRFDFEEASAVDVEMLFKEKEGETELEASSQRELQQARNRLVNAASDALRLAQRPFDHVATMAYGAN